MRVDRGLRYCRACNRYTTKTQAELRVFNTNDCACGFSLVIVLEPPPEERTS